MRRCTWCIEAALLLPISITRTRIFSLFQSLSGQNDIAYPVTSPASLRSILQGAFTLLPGAGPDKVSLQEAIAGAGLELDNDLVEQEYNALYIDTDVPDSVRSAIVLQALVVAMENSSPMSCRWLLHNAIQVCLATLFFRFALMLNG